MSSSTNRNSALSPGMGVSVVESPHKILALCAAEYVSPRQRILTIEETAVRLVAYGLKRHTLGAIEIAAPAMAALISGPCWLVPVPASSGSLTANVALACAIAKLVHGSRVLCAVRRAHPVESSRQLRLRGLLGLSVSQHAIVCAAVPTQHLALYFVDNVITSGATIAACVRALGGELGWPTPMPAKP